MAYLNPEAVVAGLPQGILLLITAGCLVALIKGAGWLVEGAAGLAFRLGISKVIVGATVVSLGTTSPECAVSVTAAWRGEPGLALGNAIGSIIADTGLIFGLGCMLAVLPADRFVLRRQGWVQFGSGMLLATFCLGTWLLHGDQATLQRWVGLVFLALLVLYMLISIRWSREHPVDEFVQSGDERDAAGLAALVATGVFGLLLVLASSRVLIPAVTELAEVHWHVPKFVIAGTLVAFGTSLPELVIGLTSVLKRHGELLVGNIVGADILNVLFVVGASAAAAPLPLLEHGARLPEIALYVQVPTMVGVLLLFRLFIQRASRTGRFRRGYGVPLVLIYVAYTVIQYRLS